MADRFVIQSAAGDARFELRADEKDTWIAALSRPGLDAEHPVYAYRPHASFSGFFADLAATWRGWEGEKTYRSLEGELLLRCTHDGVAHVTITVELRIDPVGDWRVQGSLAVEPGQLNDLARAAEEFSRAWPCYGAISIASTEMSSCGDSGAHHA